MKLKLAVLAAVMVAVPAIAQEAAAPTDTVKLIVEKGITIDAGGMVGDIIYSPDGKFSGFDGMFEGTYKTDGNKICIESAVIGTSCSEYPDGKKSGDSFEMPGPQGTMTVTIK